MRAGAASGCLRALLAAGLLVVFAGTLYHLALTGTSGPANWPAERTGGAGRPGRRSADAGMVSASSPWAPIPQVGRGGRRHGGHGRRVGRDPPRRDLASCRAPYPTADEGAGRACAAHRGARTGAQ